MSSPQVLFDFGVIHEKMSGGISLEDLYDCRDEMLGSTTDQQMNMIRHELHGIDCKPEFVCDIEKFFLYEFLDIANENLLPILNAPY